MKARIVRGSLPVLVEFRRVAAPVHSYMYMSFAEGVLNVCVCLTCSFLCALSGFIPDTFFHRGRIGRFHVESCKLPECNVKCLCTNTYLHITWNYEIELLLHCSYGIIGVLCLVVFLVSCLCCVVLCALSDIFFYLSRKAVSRTCLHRVEIERAEWSCRICFY